MWQWALVYIDDILIFSKSGRLFTKRTISAFFTTVSRDHTSMREIQIIYQIRWLIETYPTPNRLEFATDTTEAIQELQRQTNTVLLCL